MTPDYAVTLVKMAGYRNRMVRLYQEIGADEMFGILRNNLADIERFIIEIGRLLEEYRKGLPKA